MDPQFHLTEKVALVTGAADGIGYAIAEAFVKAGATVEMSDINEAGLKAAVTNLREGPGEARGLHCDVADTISVNLWIRTCRERNPTLDILVNNAAVGITGDIIDMPEDDWNRVLNTNLTSAFRTLQQVLPVMLEQRSGSVINISSIQGHRSYDHFTAYAAAKGALLSMTRQLAGQYGSAGVRFNTISPSAINTPMNKRRAEEEGPAFVKASTGMHAIPRFGEPEEVAAAALFLASDAAAFVTGHDLIVDGGLSTLPRYFE